MFNKIVNDQEPSEYFLDDFDELEPYSAPEDIAGSLEARLSEFRKLGRYENVAMRRLKMAKERYIANSF